MGHDAMESVRRGTNGWPYAQGSATTPRRRFKAERQLKIVRDADVLDDVGSLRLEIDREAASASGLGLSAKIVRLARS